MSESDEKSNRSGGKPDRLVSKPISVSNRIWLILLLLLLIALFSYAGYRKFLKAEIDSRLQSIKKSGSAVELAQLDALYVTPPPGSNAADLYLAAFAKMIWGDTNSPQLPVIGTLTLGLTNELTPVSLGEADSLIRSNQTAFAQLEEATKLKECRYPVQVADGFEALLPHLNKLKSMARLLQLRAIVSSENGDSAAAVKSMELILPLGDSIRREPSLISYMVRIATVAINASALEQALNRTAFSEKQLATLQDVFARSEDTNGLSFAFTGERCLGISAFKNPREFILTAGFQRPAENDPADVLFCVALQGAGFFDRDQIFHLDTLSGWIDAAKLQYPERIDDFKEKFDVFMQNRNAQIPYIVSFMLLPSLEKVVQRDARLHAVARISQTAAAVERFRLRHGYLPKNLEQLTPEFLIDALEDPFDGEPLRYQKIVDGHQIYSVGSDQVDNGGRRHPKGFSFDEQDYDLAFVVHHGDDLDLE